MAVILLIIKVAVVFFAVLGSVPFWIWMERRVLARMQQRIGPNRVGPEGLLQAIADGLKLFFKEDVIPGHVDRGVYVLAPILSIIPALVTFAVVPFGPSIREVWIEGAVVRPGPCAYWPGMRVRDLVAKAGGLKQEANQETAHLERYEDGAEAAVLTLNLVDHWDDRLHNRDYLRIYAGGEAVPTAPRPTHRPRLYEGWHIADLNIGILYILALTSLGVYGIVLAGWASNNKWSLLGGIRSSAQMISYELGMGLAILAVVLVTGTLSLRGIVEAQDVGLVKWFIVWQFPAFVLYAICGCAEVNRAPFDLPEAESELVAGYHTEYSSFKFAMFFMGEYAAMITVSAVATSLFLGGWQGPFTNWPWLGLLTVQNVPVLNWFAPLFWFLAKIFLCMFVFMWIRATLPRIRYDRLMKFGWKFLLPAGLVWLMVVALFEAIKPGCSVTASILVIITVIYLWKRPRAG